MNLHEDVDAYSELISVTAETIGLPQVYVEKDYWVTKALKNLSESEHVSEVVFKGGTSLSKAYRLIDRFSEDIDLAVFANELSDNNRKRLLRNVEGVAADGLIYLPKDARESKGSKFRKTVHQYPRSVGGEDFGQASPELLIEISSFTNPEPFESRQLQTLIAEVLMQLERQETINTYGLEDFSINVLSVKRTLVEKLLGVIKDSYDEDPASRLSDRIRHLYDICLILRKEEYRQFVESRDFHTMCCLCVEDETAGSFRGAEHLLKPLSDAPLFADFGDWRSSLATTYTNSFSGLVYGQLPEIGDIEKSLAFLHEKLSS